MARRRRRNQNNSAEGSEGSFRANSVRVVPGHEQVVCDLNADSVNGLQLGCTTCDQRIQLPIKVLDLGIDVKYMPTQLPIANRAALAGVLRIESGSSCAGHTL